MQRCVCVYVICHSMLMKVKEQLVWVCSLSILWFPADPHESFKLGVKCLYSLSNFSKLSLVLRLRYYHNFPMQRNA